MRISRIAFFGAAVVTACLFDGKQSNRGSVVDNELAGQIYLSDGSAAAGARVRAYPVNYVPDSTDAAYTTTTDQAGRYTLDSLPEGEYNILGDKDGLFSYQDSVAVGHTPGTLPPDTLERPGSLAGFVGLEPDASPRSAIVQVLGTNNYVNVNEDGSFKLENLAAGRYRLRVLTTEPEYTPLFVPLLARAGYQDTLPDTLRLPYTGIPVVTGMRAEYDTLSGIVQLSWNPVKYPNLSQYLVFRDSSAAIELSQQSIGLATGTGFSDTLLLPARHGLFAEEDTADRHLEYRIKVRSKTDKVGKSFGFVPVVAVAPAKVRTFLGMEFVKAVWDSAREADSTLLTVRVSNRFRGLAEISWALGRPDSIVKFRSLEGAHAYTDTLRFAWPAQGPYKAYVKAKDSFGTIREDSLAIPGNRAPSIDGNPPTRIRVGQEFLFTPASADPDGEALRFSATGLPFWLTMNPATGQLRGTPGASDTGVYPGLALTVTDGRRKARLPAFDLKVSENPWTKLPNAPAIYFMTFLLPIGGKIYVGLIPPGQGSSFTLMAYDPSTDSWSGRSLFFIGFSPEPQPVDGRILYLAQDKTLRSYDPGDDSIRVLAPSPIGDPSVFGRSAVSGGKYYYMCGGTEGDCGNGSGADGLAVYDPASDAWTLKPAPPFKSKGIRRLGTPVGVAGKIYLLGNVLAGGDAATAETPTMDVLVYDPATGAWSDGPKMDRSVLEPGTCVADGKLYVAGGAGKYVNGAPTASGPDAVVEEFDPATGAWTRKTDMPYKISGAFCAEIGGKLYLLNRREERDIPEPVLLRYDPEKD